MLFNSIDYLLFFPIVFMVYFLIPKRFSYLWLLVTSYFFYMCWSAEYALLMLASTLITYASGLLIEKFRSEGKDGLCKAAVAGSFALNLMILIFFKYAGFLADNINSLLVAVGLGKRLQPVSVLLPVGISFYTFQALGYTMDIYRARLPAERNVFRYALFVSFFPQLVAGPIERAKNLLTQLQNPQPFEVKRARRGLILMAWGLFLKIVLADNLARIVNPVYDTYMSYAGVEIVIATFLFAFQIYCDFAGYSYIACGSAEILGYSLMENFRCPYFGVSISDFWRRWHISLTGWFMDYLYIPLGGNRKGKPRKYINTMIVFLISGLWHGANWTFLVWGAMNGVMIVFSDATKGLRERALRLLRVRTEAASFRICRVAITFLLINFTWLFFRAPDMRVALDMLRRIAEDFQLVKLFSLSIFDMGLNTQLIVLTLLSLLLLLAVDGAKNKGFSPGGWLLEQGAPFRWAIYIGVVFVIIVFGVYGRTYMQTQFIYFQF